MLRYHNCFTFVPLPLIALALVACGEAQPVAPSEPLPAMATPGAAPMSDFLNGPAQPGNSGVFRFQDVFFTFSTDPERDVLAAHFDVEDHVLCGGSSGFEEGAIQDVTSPTEVIHTLSKLQDAPIYVSRLSDPTPLCDRDWQYQGTHSLILNDNNLLAFLNEQGANSFGWSARGTVYDTDGRRCKYHEHQNAVWSPDRTTFRFLNENIKINCQGPNS